MKNTYTLTQNQLAFINFMNVQTRNSVELSQRYKSRIEQLPSIKESEPTDSNQNTDNTSNKEKGNDNSGERGLRIHSPRKLLSFLSLFSEDELKWYTHKWDQDDVTLENLISTQASRKGDLLKRFYYSRTPINIKSYNQVWNFINLTPDAEKQYPWRDNEGRPYRIGWHSIIHLHDDNPSLPIENLMLPDGHQFKDYIRIFKKSIEFRSDLGPDGRFNRVIANAIRTSINGAVTVTFSDDFNSIGRDINIYCDVVAIHEALTIICDWIVKHKINGNEMKVDLTAWEDGYELRISHRGSYFANLKKLASPSGDLDKLRRRLFSVCDFKMTGDLMSDGKPKGAVEVFILEEGTSKKNDRFKPCRIEHLDEMTGGVEYTLKFYRP